MADRLDEEYEGRRPGSQDADGPETTIALSGDGGCIAEARRLAAAFLTQDSTGHGRGIPERVVDLTQLVVSELVTNARKYAPGPILLRLRVAGSTVQVEVWDSDPVLPTARAADPERVGQHGLEIVKAVAAHLSMRAEAVGKRITAWLPLDSGPA
ncbi:ATP-binding protein [Streptomyces sp. NPDC004096]|uniref:ATP-binding protein n=1 Tax=unclassified Streptomyces TaxID=2593676 RepID=UPI0033B751F8